MSPTPDTRRVAMSPTPDTRRVAMSPTPDTGSGCATIWANHIFAGEGQAAMPRTEEENQRIREEQRRNIIVAAGHIFADKGLAGARMADIAREAGISYGLLYHYFDTKELIFKAVVERNTGALERVIKEYSQQPVTPWERLVKLTNHFLAGMQRVPEGYLVTSQAFVNADSPQEIRDVATQEALRGME